MTDIVEFDRSLFAIPFDMGPELRMAPYALLSNVTGMHCFHYYMCIDSASFYPTNNSVIATMYVPNVIENHFLGRIEEHKDTSMFHNLAVLILVTLSKKGARRHIPINDDDHTNRALELLHKYDLREGPLDPKLHNNRRDMIDCTKPIKILSTEYKDTGALYHDHGTIFTFTFHVNPAPANPIAGIDLQSIEF